MNDVSYSQADRLPRYRSCYWTILRSVDERYDIRGYVLGEMVKACLQHRATLPAAQHSFFASYAPTEAMTYLEKRTARLLFGPRGRFSPDEYRYSTDDVTGHLHSI